MKAWQEEDIQSLLTASSEKELFARLSEAARDLGFEYCAYGMKVALPLSNPRVTMFNNYPEAWQKRYQEMGYLAIDPTVRRAARSAGPVLWSECMPASTLEFWEDAHAHGLKVGLALPMRDHQGLSSLLMLSRSKDEITRSELAARRAQMYWLTEVAHLGMTQWLASKLMPEIDVRLSDREAEVLRWTGDGKTSNDVADILGISERTVNFHINNAMLKLGASNKTAAVLRAAVLGLL